MPILQTTTENIARAIAALQQGQCIGLPTETVYGLAGDGLNPSAIARIFEIKNRPSFDPLILHVPEGYDLHKICKQNELSKKLAEKFWPGALTLILPKKDIVPDLATSGLPTVAVRMPSHPISQNVLQTFGKPLAAPSANRFGRISPTTAQAVQDELGDSLEIILDAGACEMGIESTIIDCTSEQPCILRQGAIPMENLREIVPDITHSQKMQEIPSAPGMLASHYAPRTPLCLSKTPLAGEKAFDANTGYLFWNQLPAQEPRVYRVLTPKNDFREAAAHLFQYLRELDGSGVERILCDVIPPQNLGRAILDRLQRAAHPSR